MWFFICSCMCWYFSCYFLQSICLWWIHFFFFHIQIMFMMIYLSSYACLIWFLCSVTFTTTITWCGIYCLWFYICNNIFNFWNFFNNYFCSFWCFFFNNFFLDNFSTSFFIDSSSQFSNFSLKHKLFSIINLYLRIFMMFMNLIQFLFFNF